MEKVRPWCGQPSDRRRLKNRTDRRNHRWKVGGYLTWRGCRSPAFSFFVPPPSPVVASLISPIPFPTFLVFSPAIHVRGLWKHCNASFPQYTAKMAASCKSWRGPNTIGPLDLQSLRGRVPVASRLAKAAHRTLCSVVLLVLLQHAALNWPHLTHRQKLSTSHAIYWLTIDIKPQYPWIISFPIPYC